MNLSIPGRAPAGIALSLLIAGCGGYEGGVTGRQQDMDCMPDDGSEAMLLPSLPSIQEHIFTPRCASCHGGDLPASGLRLDSTEHSHADLVEVRALENPLLFRVEPANPDDSYLVHKVEGNQLVGERMPRGGPPLDATEIATIRQWITDGASIEPLMPQPSPTPECEPAPTPSGEVEPRLSSIQEHVFTPRCAECHAGDNPPEGLRLDSTEHSHADLVDVPSRQRPTLDRVEPNAPDDSYLVHKIEGRQSTGGRMPLGRAPLSQEQIATIRQWIMEGAENN